MKLRRIFRDDFRKLHKGHCVSLNRHHYHPMREDSPIHQCIIGVGKGNSLSQEFLVVVTVLLITQGGRVITLEGGVVGFKGV